MDHHRTEQGSAVDAVAQAAHVLELGAVLQVDGTYSVRAADIGVLHKALRTWRQSRTANPTEPPEAA